MWQRQKKSLFNNLITSLQLSTLQKFDLLHFRLVFRTMDLILPFWKLIMVVILYVTLTTWFVAYNVVWGIGIGYAMPTLIHGT